MSQVSSGKGKENARTKYTALNLAGTYKGIKPETRATTGQSRHGMQSLGKVGQTRRSLVPAHLPSLKQEHKGNDPSVSLVPSSSSGGWGTKKENKEQTSKAEEQGPTLQKQAKIGQGQDISLRPNAGVAIKQGDGAKTWSSLRTTTTSTSQPTTTYFQKEFPKLGGEGGVMAVEINEKEKEPQEEKGVQQMRQLPPRFQNDQKFMDGPGGGMMPGGPMMGGFPPDQRRMFNGVPPPPGGQPFFPRPFMDAPYGPGPMPPAMFQAGYMLQCGPYQFPPGRKDQFPPYDPNFARGMPPPQRMPNMAQKPTVKQGERPLIVKDEDLKNLGNDDENEDCGWASAQDEVDYNVKLTFDDSEGDEEDTTKESKGSKSSNNKMYEKGADSRSEASLHKVDSHGGQSSKEQIEEKFHKDSSASSRSDDRTLHPKEEEEGRSLPPATQAWGELPPGYQNQVPGIPYSQPQWQGSYPPPHQARGAPGNYPYGPPPSWFYPMPHPAYGVHMPPGQQPQQQQPQPQQQQHQQPPLPQPQMQAQPPPPVAVQDNTEGKAAPLQKQQAAKSARKKEAESVAIQEARRRKQEEENRREIEMKAAAQAKLSALEDKINKRREQGSVSESSVEDKKVADVSEAIDRSASVVKERSSSESKRDRHDSEASDTSRSSSQQRSEHSYKIKIDVPPRFRKQHQQQMNRAHSEDNLGASGNEHSYLSSPVAEGRASPAMSQSSDSFPVKKIMKRHDSSRSDDACSVHSQDSCGMGTGPSDIMKREILESDSVDTHGETESHAKLSSQESGGKNSLPEHRYSDSGRDVERGNEKSRGSSNEENRKSDKIRPQLTQKKKYEERQTRKGEIGDSISEKGDYSYTGRKMGAPLKTEHSSFSDNDEKNASKGHETRETERSDNERRRGDFMSSTRRNRDYKSHKLDEDALAVKNDKQDKATERKNFKRLEKSSGPKVTKSGSSKDRTNKLTVKESQKHADLSSAVKRPPAWSKVVAGERDEEGAGQNSDGQDNSGTQTLTDIQKEQEENQKKEAEDQKRTEETNKGPGRNREEQNEHYGKDDYVKGDRSSYGERRDYEKPGRRRGERDYRAYKEDRKGYGYQYSRGDEKSGQYSSRTRDKDRSGRIQERDKVFKEQDSDDNGTNARDERRESSNADTAYFGRQSKYEKHRTARTSDRRLEKSAKSFDRDRDRDRDWDQYRDRDRDRDKDRDRDRERDKDRDRDRDRDKDRDRDQEKEREKTKARSSREEDGRYRRGDYVQGNKDSDRKERFRTKDHDKELHEDSYGDGSYRKERRQGMESAGRRQPEERKRKHEERGDSRFDQRNKDTYSDQGRDDGRRNSGRNFSHGDTRGSQSGYSQGKGYGMRGSGHKDTRSFKGDGFIGKKTAHLRKGTTEDEQGQEAEFSDSKKDKERKEKERIEREDIEEDHDGADELEGEVDDVKDQEEEDDSDDVSADESDVDDVYHTKEKGAQKSKDRSEEGRRSAVDYDGRGSRERRGYSRSLARSYQSSRGYQRPHYRQTRTKFSYKENQANRKRTRNEQGTEGYVEDDAIEDSDEYSTDDAEGDEGERKEHSSRKEEGGKLPLRSANRDSYRRQVRHPGRLNEKRREKDQPPRFKKQGIVNRSGRGRGFSRGVGRGRGYPSYGRDSSDRGRNRTQNQGHGSAPYSTGGHDEDWENDSAGSGTYHTAEDNAAPTDLQETSHKKVTSGRGRGYSKGRGGHGAGHSNSSEGRQGSFLAHRQQARGSQVSTSAQASSLPAAVETSIYKDSEVRSSFKLSGNKKSEKVDRSSSHNGYNGVGSFSAGTESEPSDEPPKKIPKNKASMEAKRDILKEYDLSNIASVVVIDDILQNSEPAGNIPADDDGFVQVTSRKTQKELREKQREEVRKKQREETSQGGKSYKNDTKDTSVVKTGKPQRFGDQHSTRFTAAVPNQGQNVLHQVPVTTQSQTSNAAMAAIGAWEPAQSLMRTSQNATTGTSNDTSKSVAVPAPPPPVNAWQRPLNFANSVSSVPGAIAQTKTPDPKAVGTGKPSSSTSKPNLVANLSAIPPPPVNSSKQSVTGPVKSVISEAGTTLQQVADLKSEESRDTSTNKKDSRKEKASIHLKGSAGALTSRKLYARGTQGREKTEKEKGTRTFPNRQPVMRREKLIHRKTKVERPPRFLNISKSRVHSSKGVLEDTDENHVSDPERVPPMSPPEEKLLPSTSSSATSSKLQGEDRAPGKRPQSYEGRAQQKTETSVKGRDPSAPLTAQVNGEALTRISRNMPLQLGSGAADLRGSVNERGEELSSTVLHKPKDDCSSAEEEENAKDTARSVIKSLSDDDEKALETRSLPGTPPLAVEIPEPSVSGPSSDPGRTASPAAPNSMAQEMSEMSKKVYFTKKLWDDVSNSNVRPVVAQNGAITTWSDGSDGSQTVMTDMATVATTTSTSVETSVEAGTDAKNDSGVSSGTKVEEKVSTVSSTQTSFGKKPPVEQQNVCKVKPQQQQQQQQHQQNQQPQAPSSDSRAQTSLAQSQPLSSQYLIHSQYPVPCQSASTQGAKLHQGYFLPVESITQSLQQAFLAQSDSQRYQELSQHQQPISLNIQAINQPGTRSSTVVAPQQQQLVLNNLYGTTPVQGTQNQMLTWQVVSTHSVHTSNSASFQSHLQGQHSGNVFNQNVTPANAPVLMTFDPQAAGANTSIFSTQRASSHLQQAPVGLVVQQQAQTLPSGSYVNMIPGSHQSSEHPFGIRTPPAKISVGSTHLQSGPLHYASSPLALGSGTLNRPQPLDATETVHQLSSGSAHLPVGQRSTAPTISAISGLSPCAPVPTASIQLQQGSQGLVAPDGHIPAQSDLVKHVNAKPFQPSAKTPPSVGVSSQQPQILTQSSVAAHQRSSHNPLVASVRPRPVLARTMPSSSPTTMALQSAGRLGGTVSPVEHGVAFIGNALPVKGQHVANLSQHALAGSSLQHTMHLPQPLQNQFPDHQAQVIGHSRAFKVHAPATQVQRFARSAPGPIQRPSAVGVVNGVISVRPKQTIQHPPPPLSKVQTGHPHGGPHQPKQEQFPLSSQQSQTVFKSQQHQKMIESTLKFFQNDKDSRGNKRSGSPLKDAQIEDLKEKNENNESTNNVIPSNNYTSVKPADISEVATEESAPPVGSMGSPSSKESSQSKGVIVVSTISTVAITPSAVKATSTIISVIETSVAANDVQAAVVKSQPPPAQPQRQMERNRRLQRTGK